MTMKSHVLAALDEMQVRWEDLLRSLTEDRISKALLPWEWSVKDVVFHLYGWQVLSKERLQAILDGREPEVPNWFKGHDVDAEDVSVINNNIYQDGRVRDWATVYNRWRHGYQQVLTIAAEIPERQLLDSSSCPWLNGYSAADILLGTYDHHAEHLDDLLSRLH